jgi:AcrR family transcriptional regulator
MTKSRRRAADARGEATRRRISAAAVELVAELGWDAVTTRAVASRAGVNPALVHYHFGSMDALLREAVAAVIEQEIDRVAVLLAEDPSLGGALAGASDAIAHPDPAAAVLLEGMLRAARDPALSPVVVDRLRTLRQQTATRVSRAAAEGELPPDLPAEASGTLVAAALDGLLLHRIVDPSTDVAGARDVLVRLLSAPPDIARSPGRRNRRAQVRRGNARPAP